MRSPTSGIAGQLSAAVTQDGYLCQIDLPGLASVRLCNLDVSFSFGGFTWVSADFDVTGINWTTGGLQSGQLTLGDSDLLWWQYALNLTLQDAGVNLWQVYAAAPGEAEPLWSGRIGSVTRGSQVVNCALNSDSQIRLVPKRRVQYLIPSTFLVPAGKVLDIGSQQWIIERKQATT